MSGCYMEIPKNEHGEPVCIKCKKTTGDFIPICDYHDKHPNQREAMECEDCATCDECLPRTYRGELFGE